MFKIVVYLLRESDNGSCGPRFCVRTHGYDIGISGRSNATITGSESNAKSFVMRAKTKPSTGLLKCRLFVYSV